MTIKELYEWALAHDVEDEQLYVWESQKRDWVKFTPDWLTKRNPDIPSDGIGIINIFWPKTKEW